MDLAHHGGKRMNTVSNSKLIDVKEVATILKASSRTIYRLSDKGKMPRPVKLGALARWRVDELSDWINSGCPIVDNGGGK